MFGCHDDKNESHLPPFNGDGFNCVGFGKNDKANADNIQQSVSISVFQIFATGFQSSDCQLPVGSGIIFTHPLSPHFYWPQV